MAQIGDPSQSHSQKSTVGNISPEEAICKPDLTVLLTRDRGPLDLSLIAALSVGGSSLGSPESMIQLSSYLRSSDTTSTGKGQS